MIPMPASAIRCFPDGRMTDAEPHREFFRDQALPGRPPPLDDVGEQRLHDPLAAKTAFAGRNRLGGETRHHGFVGRRVIEAGETRDRRSISDDTPCRSLLQAFL